jgi:pimeloyl-ACP methyl ester carboxylesterase
MGVRVRAAVIGGLVAVSGLLLPAARAVGNPFPGCAAPPTAAAPMQVAVGVVACQEMTSRTLGPGVPAPFEYYVPPACAPSRNVKCPVLYLLHGFGGDFTEMLGKPGTTTSAWIAALTHRPPAGFESAPWMYASPTTWRAAPALDMILVALHGQTLPGGYGPGAGQDSYWTDWNPRYARGGDHQRYGTPPPQFEQFAVDELPRFVQEHLPAGSGREWQSLAGVSLGGYGAYKLGLQHPDRWAAIMSVSGAHNFLFAPAPQPGAVTFPVGVQPPIPVAYSPLPPATAAVPTAAAPSQAGTFLTALTALGDPAADQAYFRGNMPPDLAMNGRAYVGSAQILGIDGFVNDTVPRQPGDAGSTPFEDIVFPMNVDMEEAYAAEAVQNTFAVHQGNHSDVYRNAWFRGLEEYAYARLDHPGVEDRATAVPTDFDYRTISRAFRIWGWQVRVERPTVEFLTLRSVSCRSLTLQGSGRVTVTVPAACHTGLGGSRTFTVDLGAPEPVDDPAAAGSTPVYGRTVTVALTCTGGGCRS